MFSQPRQQRLVTPIEKAENSLNGRIERIQANLREAESETSRRFLFQALVVCVGVGEALTDYVRMIGQYAQQRHSALKQTQDVLTAQHADLLESGKALLERLKANPTDRVIRKDIDRAQQNMAAVQKNLRRGANALQREIAPSMAMIDKLAAMVNRLGEADQMDALKRVTKMAIGYAHELYLTQPALPSKEIVDAAAWEKSAVAAIDEAANSYEAYARAGYQAMFAIDLMTIAVSQTPPRTAEEATNRASESAALRLKAITARIITP